MIQRKQTLFILGMILCNCLLLFIPIADVIHSNLSSHVYLTPFPDEVPESTLGHFSAIALNFLALLLCFGIIFLYKNRKLQIQLLWFSILIWVTLGLMMWLCPFVVVNENTQAVIMNYLTASISIPAIILAWIAIRYIQKDIDLLKRTERIR